MSGATSGAESLLITGSGPGRGRETEMNDLLVNAELEYRVNRIREDWRPIRARRARRRQRREEDARYAAHAADSATWIG